MNIAADQLRSIVERIERLNEEKSLLSQDIREVYAEAKGNGFCVKTLREIIKLRKMEAGERQEKESMIDIYMRAIGMKPDAGEE